MQLLWKGLWRCLQKLKIELAYDSDTKETTCRGPASAGSRGTLRMNGVGERERDRDRDRERARACVWGVPLGGAVRGRGTESGQKQPTRMDILLNIRVGGLVFL